MITERTLSMIKPDATWHNLTDEINALACGTKTHPFN